MWIEGKALPGTLIAFYPGIVYTPSVLRPLFASHPAQSLTEEAINDNDYIIGRYDNVVIDGRHWEKRAALQLEQLMEMDYATGASTNLPQNVIVSLLEFSGT